MQQAWLAEARRHVGLREVPGKRHATIIVAWLLRLGAWWRDDEAPWCGVFVAHCMRAAGQDIPRHWYRAKAWADWGQACAPRVGAVVVFERKGGGHVGFLAGKTRDGMLMVLGGNQGNAVTIAPFEPGRVIGYRWPGDAPLPMAGLLPILLAVGPASTDEA